MLAAASLGIGAAQAGDAAHYQLIDEGFRLFTEETFNGNGRTCATCHVPEANYNIFPSTIQRMNRRDRDLVFATNVPGLENIDLVRSHALFNISGNADTHGADDAASFGTAGHAGPVFRSSMGIHALEITSINESDNFPGTPLLPAFCSQGVEGDLAQLGWAGDASPGTPKTVFEGDEDGVLCKTHHGTFDPDADGSIRAFANGAIAQHNTITLNRIEGVDFRFATGDELDALDAFQRWLGRRGVGGSEQSGTGFEFDIVRLDFRDPRINLGRDHYVAPAEFTAAGGPNLDSGANCNGCHTNAGANTGILGVPGSGVGGGNNLGQNININTDVELASPRIGVAVVGFPLPHDEGASNSFGARPANGPGFDDAFNIQSLIEAPRKEAWFHNHRVLGDFEEAIAFYAGPDFRRDGGTPPVAFSSEQVMRFGSWVSFPKGDGIEHVGAFLRALSAYYALRDCERLVEEAIDRIDVGVSPSLAVRHCEFNLADVRKVLNGSKLHPIPYRSLANQALPVSNDLKNAAKKAARKQQMDRLNQVLLRIRSMREEIASVQIESVQIEIAAGP